MKNLKYLILILAAVFSIKSVEANECRDRNECRNRCRVAVLEQIHDNYGLSRSQIICIKKWVSECQRLRENVPKLNVYCHRQF